MNNDPSTVWLSAFIIFLALALVARCLYFREIPDVPASILGWVGMSAMLMGLLGYFLNPTNGILRSLSDPAGTTEFNAYNQLIFFGVLIIIVDLVRALTALLKKYDLDED